MSLKHFTLGSLTGFTCALLATLLPSPQDTDGTRLVKDDLKEQLNGYQTDLTSLSKAIKKQQQAADQFAQLLPVFKQSVTELTKLSGQYQLKASHRLQHLADRASHLQDHLSEQSDLNKQ